MSQRLPGSASPLLQIVPAETGALSTSPRRAGGRPLLLCFSHLRWDFVWQRPQHLLTRASGAYDVVVLEEPIISRVAKPELDVTSRGEGVRVCVPRMPEGVSGAEMVEAQRRLLDRFLAEDGRAPALLWYYTPMAVAFSKHLSSGIVIYDNMDELSAFRGASPEMLAHEAELFARADLVFTGGQSLYEAKRDRHPDVTAFPSSIDVHHFARARRPAAQEPADQAGIARPRIGFFGVIDERMDVDLVRAVAELRPDWQFVMIGPVVKIDAALLPRASNLHWLGHKGYDELPSYLAGWDAGLMPFARNEATRFISPTKTPEYLAAGIPVVSTRIRDVVRPYGEAGLVEIADGPQDVAAKLEAVLARPAEPWLAAVDAALAGGSWDKTWASMQDKIAAAAAPRPAVRPVRAAGVA